MFSKCCHDPVYYANRDCATLDTSRINIVRTSISSILFSRPRFPVVSRLVHVLFLYLPSHPPQRISPFCPTERSLSRLLLILRIHSFSCSLILSFIYYSTFFYSSLVQTTSVYLFGFLFISLQ